MLLYILEKPHKVIIIVQKHTLQKATLNRSGQYEAKKWISPATILNEPVLGIGQGKKFFLKNMHFWVVLWLF